MATTKYAARSCTQSSPSSLPTSLLWIPFAAAPDVEFAPWDHGKPSNDDVAHQATTQLRWDYHGKRRQVNESWWAKNTWGTIGTRSLAAPSGSFSQSIMSSWSWRQFRSPLRLKINTECSTPITLVWQIIHCHCQLNESAVWAPWCQWRTDEWQVTNK